MIPSLCWINCVQEQIWGKTTTTVGKKTTKPSPCSKKPQQPQTTCISQVYSTYIELYNYIFHKIKLCSNTTSWIRIIRRVLLTFAKTAISLALWTGFFISFFFLPSPPLPFYVNLLTASEWVTWPTFLTWLVSSLSGSLQVCFADFQV